MNRILKICILSSFFLLPISFTHTSVLHAQDAVSVASKKAALEKELAQLNIDREKYASWARYADSEAGRLMSRDWIEYQEYLRMQRRAQAKIDLIDLRREQIQQELSSLK